MACCLTAPSHYLNQCWLVISEVQWHLYQGNFTRDASTSNTKIHLKMTYLKFHAYFPGANELIAELAPNPYPNGPEAGREAAWGSEFVPLKKREVGSFILLHKISRTACCFGIRTFLKQYSCYASATIWYTDHQYLAQYSEIINKLPEIPLIFCNYAVRSCGTWRRGPGQSPCDVLSISDLELYVTETSTGVCDPVTD